MKIELKKIKFWHLAFVLLGVVAAFASTLPDGLEWSLKKLGIKWGETYFYHAPLADYTLPLKLPPVLNSLFVAVLGGLVVAALLYGVSIILTRRKNS